jgi:endonuclease YncB( thermonuclease family)
MMGGRKGIMAAALAAGVAAATCGWWSAGAQEQPRTPPGCDGETLAQGAAGRVLDGRTFALEDGREIRLAGIKVPPLPEPQEKSPAPGGTAARDALAGLLSGAQITLKQADAQKTDRYDRIIAYAFAKRDGADHAVQADLIAAGRARVAARVGNRACAMELLRRETLARKAKLGLWGSSYYDLLNADNPTDVLAEQGRFALVEGRVLSVRESGATIYVNFGRRWTEDFTVTILKRNERNFTAAGLEPKKLAGRQIRVRGWIEERGGPWIEATRPEQIEFADRE